MALRRLWIISALFVRDASPLVVAVTHAAGRMGVSVVGQLRETWDAGDTGAELQLRAIVRSQEEAARLKLDLCGGVIRDGKLLPLRDLRDDLGIEVFTVADDADEPRNLAAAFDGVDVAVLLSAAHADFMPSSASGATTDMPITPAPDDVVPGNIFHARALSAYSAAYAAAGAMGISVRVPPVTGAAAARRLSAEVASVTTSGTTLRHVVLRSSMGVDALAASSQTDADGDSRELAASAVQRMGGAATLAAQADAESALRRRCEQRGIAYTVMRLGALVDSAGGVPLAFGRSDAQLLEQIEDNSAREPPLISRNDAARLVAEIVCGNLSRLNGAIVDAAWQPKWGMSSAGTEEAARTAARQDLVSAAVKATETAAK